MQNQRVEQEKNNIIKKIVEYEKIKYQLSLKPNETQKELTNSLSKNIKILRLNTNKVISNGFFGL